MGDEASALIPVALDNDRHFWALTPAPWVDHDTAPWVDKDDPLGPWVARLQSGRDDDHDDDHDPPSALSDNLVAAELLLTQALLKWEPFKTPSPEVVAAMQEVARATRQEASPRQGSYESMDGRMRAIQTLRLEEEGRQATAFWLRS